MTRPCKSNVGRLFKLMDGRLRPGAAEALRAHMKVCPGCAKAYDRLVATRELCREIGQKEPPELAWRRTDTQLRWRLARDERPSRLWYVQVGLSLAGASAIGALAALLILDLAHRPEAPPTAAIPRSAPASRPAVAPASAVLALEALPTLIQGEVEVLSGQGRRQRLTLGRLALQGDRVRTGAGRVALQWQEQTGLLLVEDSEVELASLTRVRQELVLWQGEVDVEVGRRQADEWFSVLAQGIRARVRGTRLTVATGWHQVKVAVHEGSVLVDPLDGSWEPVLVPSGFMVEAAVSGREQPSLRRIPSEVSSKGRPGRLNLQPAFTTSAEVLARTGNLLIRSDPPGAEIRLDGQVLGFSDLQARSAFSRRLIEAYREGVLVERRFVEFQPDLREVEVKGEPEGPRILSASLLPRPVQRVLRDVLTPQLGAAIRRCYERRLKQNIELKGKLELVLTVEKDGRITQTRLVRDTLRDAYVARCSLDRAQRLRVDSVALSRSYPISLVFDLTPR